MSPGPSRYLPWILASILLVAVGVANFYRDTAGIARQHALAGVSDGQTGRIFFVSHNVDYATLENEDMRGLPVTIEGTLMFPPVKAGERVPAVVFLHGSNGLGPLQRRQAKAVRELGMATFVIDSFSNRGYRNIIGNQNAVTAFSMLVDAFSALNLLSKHRRIDPDRIAIVGWSKGGLVAHMSAFEHFRSRLARGNLKFASHVAIYPWCGAQEIRIRLSGAPMLYLVGERDDWAGSQSCSDYVERAREAGFPTAQLTFSSAEHGFDIEGRFRTYIANAISLKNCAYFIRPRGYVISKTGEFRRWSTFKAYLSGCISHGAHVGTNRHARRKANEAIDAFLLRTLKP